VIVMPLIVLENYLIRKGHGVFNIHDYINAFLGSNNVEEGYASLINSHHDLNHDSFAGVEADAVKLAFDLHLGGLTDQDRDILNAGEAANPTLWHQTFQKAVNAGAEEINNSIKRQNMINAERSAQSGIPTRQIPLAFEKDMGNYVAVAAWRTPVLGRKGEGDFNSQGALITQYVSKLNGKPEAYARPYHNGLTALRRERAEQMGIDLKGVPKASDEIKPGLLHGDTIYIRDNNLRSKFALTVQGIKQRYPNANPEMLQGMALQALRNLPEFNQFAGNSHSDGLQIGNFSDAAMEARATDERFNQADSYGNLMNFIHPNMRNHAINNTTGHSYYHNENPSKKMLSMYEEHYGWDEETSRRVHENAYSGKYDGVGMNRAEKLMAAKRDELMAGGKPPEWAGEAIMPRDSAITSPVEPAEPLAQDSPTPAPLAAPPPPTTPIQEAVSLPPPVPVRADPPPPPPNPSVTGAIPVPVAEKPPPPPMQTLNTYPSNVPPSQNTGRGFLDNLMTRLGYAYETLFPSYRKSEDAEASDVLKEMLENVQLELAKSALPYSPLYQPNSVRKSSSIASINDVSMVAQRMNRPNSDIISIFHSRGDWESIAKSFGLTHQDVQYVKVIFNE
tara:strand:- start:1701 stop:3557 length:1857 start_codon:yes stop_codon:yes gene_type:complete